MDTLTSCTAREPFPWVVLGYVVVVGQHGVQNQLDQGIDTFVFGAVLLSAPSDDRAKMESSVIYVDDFAVVQFKKLGDEETETTVLLGVRRELAESAQCHNLLGTQRTGSRVLFCL